MSVERSPLELVSRSASGQPMRPLSWRHRPTLTRVYAPTEATLLNNNEDITMNFFDHKDGTSVAPGAITVTTPTDNGGTKKTLFKFKVIHWHMPSEHTINGQRFPMELHLVHTSEDGHLAVISILYKIGEPDAFYDQIKEKLQELKEDPIVHAGVVDLKSLQKRTGSYFRYMGSLTMPLCTEKVIWNILGKVREISAEQLELVKASLPHEDNRPAQPLNGRVVQFYNPPNSTVSFETI